MVRTEIIIQVGAEGGSLTLEGKHYGDTGLQFRIVRNEAALADFCVDENGPYDVDGLFE